MGSPVFGDAVRAAGLPLPVSHDDLVRTFATLRNRAALHNLIGEPVWRKCMAEARERGLLDEPCAVTTCYERRNPLHDECNAHRRDSSD